MKEYRFRQFERNRYFPGKTLTVRDFKAEQEYLNQKRWMINRLVHGTGILWGLQVQKDGENVAINPGMAIDCFGREIIISMPVKVRISDIEGAPPPGSISGDKEFDFCVEYYDDERELVETAGNFNSCCNDGVEYNRIKEKYKFRIVDKVNQGPCSQAHFTSQNLINNGEVSVTVETPAWVNPNELFKVRITIERKVQKAYSIAITPILDKNLYFEYSESNSITVDINSNNTNTVLTKEFFVKANSSPDFKTPTPDAAVKIKLSVKCPDTQKEFSAEGTNWVKIVDTTISDLILGSHFKKENQIIDTGNESVKLASLKLVKDSRALLNYTISEVLNAGTGAYVCSNDVLYELLRDLDMRLINQTYSREVKTASASIKRPDPSSTPYVNVEYKQMEKHLGFDFGFPKEMATGIVYFDIESEILMAGDNGITEVINPGLGKGPVYVDVQWEQCRYRETVVPKDSVVFGAYPNIENGTFRIWYRVLKDIKITKNKRDMTIHTLHFRWWAYNNVHNMGESRARRFSITPKRFIVRKKKDDAYTLDLNSAFTANYCGIALNGKDKPEDTPEVKLDWKVLPLKPSGKAPDFAINNNILEIPAGTGPKSFMLKGKYKKMDVFDKVFVTIVNEPLK